MHNHRPGKILFFDQYATIGGGQSILLNLLSIAQKEGILFAIAAPGRGELERSIAGNHPDTTFIPIYEPKMNTGAKSLRDIWALFKLFFDLLQKRKQFKKFDAFYVNGARLYLPICILSILFFRKTSVYYHFHLEHTEKQRKLIHWIYSRSTTRKFIFCSEYIANIFRRESSRETSKFCTVTNSLSLTHSNLKFSPDAFSETKLKVVVIGRICQEKGQDAVLKMAPNFADVDFYFIGGYDFHSPDYFKNLKDNELKNVHLVGKVANVINTVQELKPQISIVPSRWQEPFGLVALESAALSCMTFVRNRGGLSEIASKIGAIRFESDEELEILLRSAIEKTPEERKSVAEMQHLNAIEQFHFDQYHKRWMAALEN